MSKNAASLMPADSGVFIVERTVIPRRGTFTLIVPDTLGLAVNGRHGAHCRAWARSENCSQRGLGTCHSSERAFQGFIGGAPERWPGVSWTWRVHLRIDRIYYY